MVAGPSKAKSHRIENSALGNLRASLKDEVWEMKRLLLESQRKTKKLLKPKISENENEENGQGQEYARRLHRFLLNFVNGFTLCISRTNYVCTDGAVYRLFVGN